MSDPTLEPPVARPAQPDRAGAQRAPVSSAGPAPLSGPAVDIEARDVTKRFGDTPVFSGVSFRLARGEAIALVGANGAGKSTLLRCLMGLIPVSGGTVSLLGRDATGTTGAELRRLRARIGLVSQKHNLVPRLSVLSNVIHGLLGHHPGLRHWSHHLAPAASRDAAMAALEKVGLADFALRRADRLSGGQSQRVAIARAIVGAPEILFADEPCASLDPAAGEDVMHLFMSLARQDGVTVVFTSHNLDHTLRYGDRVLGLAEGRMRLDATAASLTDTDLRGLYD
ncbi:phosphate-import ATP-binding protein PhnC [Primorskyibacter flagellatus]|uniref:Phosphate-import ATP-binding protein PhnC n=1 Tax=Primorskyibacter flagellatus TaxID=1387277 RepID=A0A916ZXP8_9RHOB|nr:ATP-binding cassette domain-containing protein [Primorskyibacter flagellatus]GGE16332.1 phosphate-import ATP-binding protein PhnC [Primorskyibacter flagellatus]